jgi:hypothetical protein
MAAPVNQYGILTTVSQLQEVGRSNSQAGENRKSITMPGTLWQHKSIESCHVQPNFFLYRVTSPAKLPL